MYIYVCVCMYIYIHIVIYVHIHITHGWFDEFDNSLRGFCTFYLEPNSRPTGYLTRPRSLSRPRLEGRGGGMVLGLKVPI